MINTEELALTLNKYSLGELASPIERLTDGWTNLTFKFHTKTDGKTYILREYLPSTFRKLSLEDIKFELDFLTYLFNEINLPVAPPVNPPGIFIINNGNYCVIFPFIDGIKYVEEPENPIRELWQTLEISRFLGRMHSNIKTKKFPLIPSNRRLINFTSIKYELVYECKQFEKEYPDLYERIRLITDQHTESIPLISDEDEQDIFEKNFEKNLPIGYIHADIHDDNVLFCSNENKIAAVLDFDDMYIGPLVIDLASTLCLWCQIGLEFNFEYAKEFISIYENERQMLLNDDEWNLLEIYCYLTMLNQILFVIDAEHCATSRRNMVNLLLLPIEYISKEKKKFLEKIRQIK
jgi:Ser/Thr protein kinase RdoA (MazF antagonist)